MFFNSVEKVHNLSKRRYIENFEDKAPIFEDRTPIIEDRTSKIVGKATTFKDKAPPSQKNANLEGEFPQNEELSLN